MQLQIRHWVQPTAYIVSLILNVIFCKSVQTSGQTDLKLFLFQYVLYACQGLFINLLFITELKAFPAFHSNRSTKSSICQFCLLTAKQLCSKINTCQKKPLISAVSTFCLVVISLHLRTFYSVIWPTIILPCTTLTP